jgi:DNA-binding MarR family transcriptional regulator
MDMVRIVEKSKERLIQNINRMGLFWTQTRLDCWIELNLTMSQLKSLFYIEFQDNISIGELSRVLKMAQPNVTALVDFLVKEGLVRRKENPEDRRKLILKTTTKGKKLIADLQNSLTSEMSEYLDLLSVEQLQALADGLQPMINVMKEKQNRLGQNTKLE